MGRRHIARIEDNRWRKQSQGKTARGKQKRRWRGVMVQTMGAVLMTGRGAGTHGVYEWRASSCRGWTKPCKNFVTVNHFGKRLFDMTMDGFISLVKRNIVGSPKI